MDTQRGKRRWMFLGVGLLASLALVAAGCTSSDGVPEDEFDAVSAELTAAQAEIVSLRDQVASPATTTIVQAGTIAPAPPGAVVTPWDTDASIKAGAQLIATYDSSGDPAWDPAAHPIVFVTSEGEGYAGFVSETNKLPGLQIIDATTRQPVASALFDLGFEQHAEPHGMGVSPDGQWIYVPTSDGGAPWQAAPNGGRLLVVNAQTLKLDRVIGTVRGPHHVKAFVDANGDDRIIVETQGATIILDPNDDHKVVFTISAMELHGDLGQVDVDPAGENLYIGLTLGGRGPAPDLLAAVAKVSLETGRATYITDVGMYLEGFAFTADGKYTYVADASGDRIYKIDNATNKSIGSTQAAVPGPYMIELNFDETELWVVGKGEMTFNLGGSLGLIDTRSFRAVNAFDIGGQTIDHNVVNPANPEEMWVTSSGTAEVIVWNTAMREVTDRIPTANGGDTHSGAFVGYQSDFTGELLADNAGLHGSFLAQRIAGLPAAATR
jgi:DNA-binding beta-propeller fold protein YncE